ncbi:restriction endonuclease subunit S [Acidovorax sp. JMULE5]|uniref:restriction endonuclease subunit S n=1 Tax=Acidovorax sp. JMULE5 TaxID=2518343 RepID=UPI0015A05C6F|nr:restriction endonuclease subunit S [Acidovorax sp. JMULE5]QLA80392.1 restriction endonuclease subunit S [Acidovorax sp. JMULE5]
MSFPRYPQYKDSGVEWLGEVPAHWGIDRLKASIISSKNGIWGDDAKGDENDIPCVRVADFDRQKLRAVLMEPTIRNVTSREREGRSLKKGDLLLEKSGGGENQPVGCVVLYDDERPAVCSNFVARVQLAPGMVSSFWRYVHAAAYAVRLTTGSINQTSGIQNLDQDRYFNERAAFPTPEEQTAIATFLDRETAKIDALVTEQEKLIALLQEKRQALISQAVTKGLDPNVQMRDSGVEWLGEVPEHWEIRRVRALSSFLTSGPRGWSERVGEVGAKFIQSGDLTGDLSISFDDAKRVAVNDDAEAARTKLADGDVVVCITGAKTGNVAVCGAVPEDAYVNQHLCLIRPRPDILSDLLAIYLKSDSGQRYFAVAQYGLKQGMSLENIKEAPVPVPPVNEQRQIVDVARDASRSIGALVNEARTAISLLHERRTALISAAVTGQIDVRRA